MYIVGCVWNKKETSMAKAKLQQKRWHLDGGIEVTSVEEGGKSSPSTYLGNYNVSGKESLALVAYTGSYYDLVDYPELTNYIVDGNYVHTDNNFTGEEKAKLANLFNYTLPVATPKRLGGVKVGDHLEMRVDPEINAKDPVADRISVIENHFIMVKSGSATKYIDIPENGAGKLNITANYSPTGNRTNGYYIHYSDMVFYSEDPKVETKEFNGKTIKIEQDFMSRGGLWWTTKKSGQWIKVLDQFNIVSFNNRVGKVYPVGMDDLKVEAEDYTADMVGAVARRAEGGNWAEFKNKAGRVVRRLWNGVELDKLENSSAGWARIGAYGWDDEKSQLKPDPINSPTGAPITGAYWKFNGLPTLPTYNPDPYYPDTYRGIGHGAFFFIPDNSNRIWVKRGNNWEENNWFYLEQLPIATRTRLGGIVVGDGLQITESGVLSIVGIVTSWTGKQGARRVNEVVAMAGDYDASMITYGNTSVDAELKRLVREINLKAPINSPAFTGTPTAPDPNAMDKSNRLATTRWVQNFVEYAVNDIVGYELPIASSNTLGGIKIGSGLTISSDGTVSVNVQGGGSGSGGTQTITIDPSLSASSTNPVENRAVTNAINAINNTFDDYVLKNNGTANNLTVTKITINGDNSAPTQPPGTSNTTIATTAFVKNAIDSITNVGGGGGSGTPTITPYVLPVASASTLGGVRVTGNDGISISGNGTIFVDYDKLQVSLKYVSSENVIGTASARKTWADIPDDSSGYVFLQAPYAPTSKDTDGWYIKYNYGGNADNYVMWFCDSETRSMWYLIHTQNSNSWSKTLSMDGAEAEDFDLSLYAKIESPVFTGNPQAPTPVYGGTGIHGDTIVTVNYVSTAVRQLVAEELAELPKASTTQYGVVKIRPNSGIDVEDGVISNSGIVKFNGRSADNGNYKPQSGDYTATLITCNGLGGNVQAALNKLNQGKASLANPAFTGRVTIGGQTAATQNWVTEQIGNIPYASATVPGLIKVGNGLSIDSNGVLTTSGAVTSWNTRTGDVTAEPGDYHAAMIYYAQGNSSQTVKSELDLKAYRSEVWLKNNISSLPDIDRIAPVAYSGGQFGTNGHLTFPLNGNSERHYGVLIFANDAGSYGNNVVSVPNIYITSSYTKTNPGASASNYHSKVWAPQVRLLTTRDLASPAFTGTPTINGNPIAVSRVAGQTLGLVKNGGNVVVDASGNMNYSLPMASDSSLGAVKVGGNVSIDSGGNINYLLPVATGSSLGGVKIGSGLSVSSDGTLSTSGAVTTWNSRTGDVVPQAGDYNATQITYDPIKSVKDKFDEIDLSIGSITDGSALPIASATQIGVVKIGDGIDVDANGIISMSGVTTFNGRTGNVFPLGKEQDYTAEMVNAIRRGAITLERWEDAVNYSSGAFGPRAIGTNYNTITSVSGSYIRLPMMNSWNPDDLDVNTCLIDSVFIITNEAPNIDSIAIPRAQIGVKYWANRAHSVSDIRWKMVDLLTEIENYTTTEVDAAIQATLTELAS